jgi:heme exporter protein B
VIIIRLIVRDFTRSFANNGIVLPVIFFLMVATLYPFAIGPDGPLLARTGGGVLWVAALLAALLPVDRLVAPDASNGVLDQFAVRGITDEIVALAKLCAHWLGFGPALMLAAVPAAGLLRLDETTFWTVEVGLLLGTPGLAALGLMMLPLAIPILIFGAGSLAPSGVGGLKLLAAASLLLVGIAPFAAGAAMRALRE